MLLFAQALNHFANLIQFQWAPTLGGECYYDEGRRRLLNNAGFNGHPPLGVNATTQKWAAF